MELTADHELVLTGPWVDELWTSNSIIGTVANVLSAGAEARYAMAHSKFFKTSIIVGKNRFHTFSFKSWPPYEKNFAPPPIRSHKNAPS